MRRIRCTIILDGTPPEGELDAISGLSVRVLGHTVVVTGVVHDQESVVSTMVRLEALGTRVLALRIHPTDVVAALPRPVPVAAWALEDLRP